MTLSIPWRGSALLAILVLSAVGCAPAPVAPPPLSLKGHLQAAADVNPDLQGKAAPVVLRVYQLRAPGLFQGADFFALFDQEAAALGQDLVAREEFLLQPGARRDYARQMDPATRYLAVVAAYRDLSNARWRDLQPVPAHGERGVLIRAERLAVTVSVSP